MARRPTTGMFTNVQEMSPDEFASGVTALPFIIESSGGDAFKENLIDIPRYEDIDEDENLRNRLESMLGGIGQSELGSIWADPTMEQILEANTIKMNPEAPFDISMATGVTTEALQQLADFISGINEAGGYETWLEQQETDEVDINDDDTIPPDTTETDTTTDTTDTDTTTDTTTIPNYEDFVNPESAPVTTIPGVASVGTGVTTVTPTTPITPPPGSAGVIIDIEDLIKAGDWRVFLPGVIPGLPSSPTILGTIEEILSAPEQVLGDLWNDLVRTVSNPQQVLEDILNGVVDEDGNITIGAIGGAIGGIFDAIENAGGAITYDADGNPIVNPEGSILGGREDEPDGELPSEPEIVDEEVIEVIEDRLPEPEPPPEPPPAPPPEPEIVDEEVIEDIVDRLPAPETSTPEIGTVIDPEPEPEPEPEIGTTESVTGGGGGGGGMLSQQTPNLGIPSIGYQPVQLQQLITPSYQSVLDDIIRRNSKGMFTGPEDFLLS